MTVTEGPPRTRPADPPPLPDLSDGALDAVAARLATTAAEHDRSGAFPWAGLHAVHEAGLLRLGIGPRHGGATPTATDLVRVLLALGRGDPSVGLITAMTVFQHVFQARTPWWPPDLYAEVVADSAVRPVLLNAVRAEPEWGAPARGGRPATTIARTADGWVVTGRKGFATGAEGLAYHLVWVATDEPDPLLAHAIVPGDAPGITVEHTWDQLGLRASGTHDVVYDRVEIPAAHFVGTRESQLPRDAQFPGSAALALPALYVGVARAAQRAFADFAHARVPTSLGRPIATTEHIQTVAGEIEAQLVGAEELLLGLAGRVDRGDPAALPRLAVAKLLASRAAIGAVQAAVAALGNPGLSRHRPLERHLRDVLHARPHPPQDDAALLIAGRTALAAAAPPPEEPRR